MTYSHALRYLTASDAPMQESGIPSSPVKSTHTTWVLCFTRGKLGSAAACMVASVLEQAGVAYLHWIDDDTLEPRSRFLINGRPIPPPLLAHHTGLWQAAARTEGRDPSPAERCAGVLSACAAQEDCRVIILESPLSVCHVSLFYAINKKVRAISLLSDGREVAQTAKNPATVEIITPAFGMAMHNRIIDICSKNDCKMITVPSSALKQASIALGGQTVIRTTKNGDARYRLPSASHVAAEAAAIALYCARSLNERGVAIPEQAMEKGLLHSTIPHCGTLYSMKPLILTHAVANAQELSQVLGDLATLQDCADATLTVWAEPSLLPLPPEVVLYEEDSWNANAPQALLLIGSVAWIEGKLSLRGRKKG